MMPFVFDGFFSCGIVRQYPPKFGVEVASLSGELKDQTTRLRFPSGPVPPSSESLLKMPVGGSDLWGFAAIEEVARYLRGGTTLKIPRQWRPFVAEHIDPLIS